jgi:hypothetical protein
MVKINTLEIENVKRVRAVKLAPSSNGLTVIGGRNNQGKTTVLDAIAWTLGGNKYRPTSEQRDGSVIPPFTRIELNNGIVVERSGKNGSLKVTDSNGNKGGQQLLDSFVEQFALSLPKFLNASSKEKADILLRIIGVGDQLYELEQQETDVYNRRHAIGQIADQKKKHAAELPYFPDMPRELVPASELIRRQQDILAKNGENQQKRSRLAELEGKVSESTKILEEAQGRLNSYLAELEIAQRSAQDLRDESTAELERSIEDIESTNAKVRINADKERAEDESRQYATQYDALSAELETVRSAKTALLKDAPLPMAGLTVQNGELLYGGKEWDCISGSDQLIVSTAIIRKLNPNCGFVLMDKLEQLDVGTLKNFGEWLEREGLQAIATRVSTGEECSIIIEDGYVIGTDAPGETKNKWETGVF